MTFFEWFLLPAGIAAAVVIGMAIHAMRMGQSWKDAAAFLLITLGGIVVVTAIVWVLS